MFSSLLIYDQEVNVGQKVEGHMLLREALSKTERLKLKYSENNFTIQLGTDAGLASNDKRFVYKLEGFRDTWNKTAENNPNITFMSLHAGDYKLRVRMLNDDGTMGEQEATLDIHVGQPLWRTNWAILLYVVLVAVIAWWWRRRFMKRQEEHMRMEQLRRETEKTQWMHEMQSRWEREHQNGASPQKAAEPQEEASTAEAEEVAPTVLASTDQLILQDTDLVDLARHLCDSYQMTTGNQRLSFLSLVEELTLPLDRRLMEQALRILIDNSVKFSPTNGRIKVLVDRVGNKAELRVADNGLGIPEEAKPFMFTPPVANDDSIGLWKVKEIAEIHGGSVRVTDNTPTGTVFYIILPLKGNANDDTPVEDAVVVN